MFELLFKYPLDLWKTGSIAFDSGWSFTLLSVAILLGCFVVVASLWRSPINRLRKTTIAALQSVFVALVVVMLWQPVLIVATTEPGENTVAWVVDDSTSMNQSSSDSVNEELGRSRYDAALSALDDMLTPTTLDFSPSLYTLGENLNKLERVDQLPDEASDVRSNLLSGLNTLVNTVNEAALAAVVLLSDGADNTDVNEVAVWQSLAAAGIPVHVVGIGQERLPADVQLSDVVLPQVVSQNSLVSAQLHIRHDKATNVRVRVSAGDELLAAEDISLPAGVQHSTRSIEFFSGERGIRQLEFSLEVINDLADQQLDAIADPNLANNRQPRLLEVADSPKRILYLEGEPRWEYKFLRRALNTHPGVDVVSLLRTSPNKFYRQGVRDANELAEGFPQTKEQLFAYDAVILGSLDAAELNTFQQSALRDFVSERGGSLLMLGGRHSLADGGWARSVVAAALPVVLNNRLDASTFSRERAQVVLSLAGQRTPWLHLAEQDQDNRRAWQELPLLADHQDIGIPKPGSVTLLLRSANSASTQTAEPLLVEQRYGRGQSLVLGTSGTWRWQMGLPSEDQRHEVFWRQLANHLVDRSLPRLSVDIEKPVYRDAESASVSVVAYSADYTPLQQANFAVQVTSPSGETQQVDLPANPDRPGHYVGSVPIDTNGAFVVSAVSPLAGEAPVVAPDTVERWWVSESGNAEAFNAQLNRDFLQRVADVTGGRYLPLSDVSQLAQVLNQENSALKREMRHPLWDLPIFFLGLLLLKCVEWALRLKWKRL